jgi:hypothetical protein
MKQAETAAVGVEDPRKGPSHSVFWHLAQLRKDAHGGPNIAVPPFDNRVRAGQYSKPGAGGMGGTA